jgi:hypothetical protein
LASLYLVLLASPGAARAFVYSQYAIHKSDPLPIPTHPEAAWSDIGDVYSASIVPMPFLARKKESGVVKSAERL